MAGRHLERTHRSFWNRKVLTKRFCLGSDVYWHIAVHLDHGICNVEKCSGTSGYQNGGDTSLCIEIPGTLQERGNRLFIWSDQALHKGIPHHEVGSGGVFIQKKYMTSRFDSFYDTCRLGGTATGIFCRKTMGVFAIWQVIDEHRNIHILDKAAVFRTKLQSGIICQYIFPSISGNMVVNTEIQCIQ